jgi:dTDP-D-glucose 4,6-dehydratase
MKIVSELSRRAAADFKEGLEKTVLWRFANRVWPEFIRAAGLKSRHSRPMSIGGEG